MKNLNLNSDSFLLSTLNADCGTPECKAMATLWASFVGLQSVLDDEEVCGMSVIEQAYNNSLQCMFPDDACGPDPQEIDNGLANCSNAIFRKKFAQLRITEIENIQSRMVTETFAELSIDKVVAMETCIAAWKRIRDAAQKAFDAAYKAAVKANLECQFKIHIPNEQDLMNCGTVCNQRSAMRTDFFGHPNPFTPAELTACIQAEWKLLGDKYVTDKRVCQTQWEADWKKRYDQYKAQIAAASVGFHKCCKDRPRDQSCLDYNNGARERKEPTIPKV